MLEKEVQIESNGIKLAGTLCLPAGSVRLPAVLMIHGSGPLDRDENMKGQRLEVFNTLAHHLAGEGDFRIAGHFDHGADASRCLDYLEACDFAALGGIYALEHSEGTIIAAQLSLKHSGLAGIILLSPFLEPIEMNIAKV